MLHDDEAMLRLLRWIEAMQEQMDREREEELTTEEAQ